MAVRYQNRTPITSALRQREPLREYLLICCHRCSHRLRTHHCLPTVSSIHRHSQSKGLPPPRLRCLPRVRPCLLVFSFFSDVDHLAQILRCLRTRPGCRRRGTTPTRLPTHPRSAPDQMAPMSWYHHSLPPLRATASVRHSRSSNTRSTASSY